MFLFVIFRIIFIVVYCVFFIIRLFAGWRYAGRIFNAGICRGKAISEFRSPKALPPAPPPSWARKEFCVVVCAALLTFVCMLRYWMWNVVPIWFLYSSVLMVVRCADLRSAIWFWDSSVLIVVRWADLVPVFFDIYGDTLCRSSSCILRYLW